MCLQLNLANVSASVKADLIHGLRNFVNYKNILKEDTFGELAADTAKIIVSAGVAGMNDRMMNWVAYCMFISASKNYSKSPNSIASRYLSIQSKLNDFLTPKLQTITGCIEHEVGLLYIGEERIQFLSNFIQKKC